MIKETQYKRILKALRNGERITPLAALRRFGSLRLGAVVFRIKRKEGLPIRTELIKVKGHKRVARYSMAV